MLSLMLAALMAGGCGSGSFPLSSGNSNGVAGGGNAVINHDPQSALLQTKDLPFGWQPPSDNHGPGSSGSGAGGGGAGGGSSHRLCIFPPQSFAKSAVHKAKRSFQKGIAYNLTEIAVAYSSGQKAGQEIGTMDQRLSNCRSFVEHVDATTSVHWHGGRVALGDIKTPSRTAFRYTAKVGQTQVDNYLAYLPVGNGVVVLQLFSQAGGDTKDFADIARDAVNKAQKATP